MIPPRLDFRRLKRRVPIQKILAQRGLLDRMRQRGRRLVGPCPLHGGDNPHAFVVDLAKNVWFCFTGCSAGGDVVDFVRALDRVDYRQAAQILAWLADTTKPCSAPVRSCPPPRHGFRPFTRRLQLQHDHPLIASKGIHPATAERFEVGAWAHQGFLQGCIAVRLHDIRGRPLGYAGRRLDPRLASRRGKWHFPPRLPKSQLLYGYHRVRGRLEHGVVVTECPWGVLRLFQLGVPAVALLGTSLFPLQHRLLRSVPRITLLLDGDHAGRAAAQRIQSELQPHAAVHAASLPDGSDPDDLSDHDLRSIPNLFPF